MAREDKMNLKARIGVLAVTVATMAAVAGPAQGAPNGATYVPTSLYAPNGATYMPTSLYAPNGTTYKAPNGTTYVPTSLYAPNGATY